MFIFILKDTHDANDAELARKLHENENGLRKRRQTAKKPVVGLLGGLFCNKSGRIFRMKETFFLAEGTLVTEVN